MISLDCKIHQAHILNISFPLLFFRYGNPLKIDSNSLLDEIIYK